MKTITLFLIFVLSTPLIAAQTGNNTSPFLRSSLYTFLVKSDQDSRQLDKEKQYENEFSQSMTSLVNIKKELTADDSIPKSELIQNLFSSIEIPDQFNDHNLTERILDYDQLVKAGTPASYVDSVSMAIENFFNINSTPTRLVGKWHNYTGETYEHPVTQSPVFYNMELIKERGLYNASESAKEISLFNSQGLYAIENMGKELIPNTFVMGLRLKYVSNNELIDDSQSLVKDLVGLAGMFTKKVDSTAIAGMVDLAAGIADVSVGSGYSVQAISYLYQLEWNDDMQKSFNQYIDKPIEELLKSSICRLRFVGMDQSSAGVTSSKFSKKPESALVKRATARSIDAVIAKLQSNYDVFKTKCKISNIEDGTIYAKIGLKEGLTAGDVYEVLERVVDQETQQVSFNKVGSVKVDKKEIWDNRYEAEEEMKEIQEAGKGNVSTLTATAFKGKIKNVHPGMYLRLEKKRKNKIL